MDSDLHSDDEVILINDAVPLSQIIERATWSQRATGLLVPPPAPAAPPSKADEKAEGTPVRRPANRLVPHLVTARDWLNAAGTLISALAAVLALAFAYVAQQDQQRSEAARRQAEQTLIRQQQMQAAMQTKLASLEARNLALQQQMLAQSSARPADQVRGEAAVEQVPR
ncbi:hypothetical protein [Micromonospora sediminicola]|uniref:hypothetical protein n=1 Tax=Micromonospora sediminicola TaxID=946078 RepID=UPI000B88FE93|nr:hypothetical protein [Micromonospora sediminicola]